MSLDLLYPLSRAALFQMPPEDAHAFTLKALNTLACSHLSRMLLPAVPAKPCTVMGLQFANPIGLAAGADKNGECIEGFGALGFGFLELGGVTPRPQSGNDKPRVFRLPEAQALINRLGFNNQGVEALALRLQQHRDPKNGRAYKGIIGVNLGKNKDTPLAQANEDFSTCYARLYSLIDFATLNISSPNTANLRQLQGNEELTRLLQHMKTTQAKLADQHGRYVPLSVKIAPDLEDAQIEAIARLLLEFKLDAVTATNTTTARDAVKTLPHGAEVGGLSGAPVREASNHVIAHLAKLLDGALPIIGVGGVMTGEHAKEKLQAGASLVQFYTGLIYRGPGLVAEAVKAV